jgi:hypothetical protein
MAVICGACLQDVGYWQCRLGFSQEKDSFAQKSRREEHTTIEKDHRPYRRDLALK